MDVFKVFVQSSRYAVLFCVMLLLSVSVAFAENMCLSMPVPDSKNVFMCDDACMSSAPLTISGTTVSVCLNYTEPVTVLMGFMDKDFTRTWWMNSSCEVSEDFDVVLDEGTSVSCSTEIVDEVRDQGWIFWLVSPGDLLDIRWILGPYDLGFYQLECEVASVDGVCIDCDVDCNDLFPGNIPSMLECEDWQVSSCEQPCGGDIINGQCVECGQDCNDLFPGNISSIIECSSWQDANCY